jgi:ligand-binding sensor domain-containing protein/class 3 adenylate cyclase/HD superfamily phosphodiesterase
MFPAIVSLLFCIFFSNFTFGQNEIRFKNYTINDGLSQSSALCIIQDDLNSLWVGTQDGLNRFDGKTFEVFTSSDTYGLESEYIRCATKDKKGNLWFGTNNGLTQYNKQTEKFSSYFPKDGESFQIEDISIGEDQKIWIASAEAGVYSFDKTTKKFKSHIIEIPSRKPTNIFCTPLGKIIVSSKDKGVLLYDNQSKKLSEIELKSEQRSRVQVNNIKTKDKKTILFITNNGIYELNIQKQEVLKTLELPSVNSKNTNITDAYFNASLGWVITTTGEGLFLIEKNKKTRQFTEDIFQKNTLLFNDINTVFTDNSGIIWIGSNRGLSAFNPRNRGILGAGPSGKSDNGIPSASVWCFQESSAGKTIYIGTQTGVSKLNRETGKYTHYTRREKGLEAAGGERMVLSIATISKNRLLVACADGLYELAIDGSNYKYTKLETNDKNASVKHNRAYSICFWKEDNYFVSTSDGVLLYSSKTGKIQKFEHNPTNPTQTISKGACRLSYKDSSGTIWFTTSSGGLNVLSVKNGTPTIHPYQFNIYIKKASKDYINSIYTKGNGVFWLGTSGSGLLLWDENTKKTVVYNKSHGLPNDVIYSVVADDRKTLWLSTNKGLCSFSKNRRRIKTYTEAHGLMSNEFNLGAFMKTSQGELFFGGIYGFNYFQPDELKNSTTDIGIAFTKLKIEGERTKKGDQKDYFNVPIYNTNEVVFPYENRSFTLSFQPSDLFNSELINYKYTLEGSDEGVVLLEASDANKIHFNSLSPGEYFLRLYARRGEESWSKTPAVLKISISPPLWQTWWFRGLSALLIAFVVTIYVKRRMSTARKEQQKLEEKVLKRTNEIQKKNEKIKAQKQKIEEERNKVVRQQELLQREKDKTEKLLKKVIPESTAEELKKRGKSRARAYKKVSVLFTDFVGFTHISDRMTASALVKKLDIYFTKFDQIIIKNNLEKIKTIGDAYMCAGGVPVRNNTNPIDTCVAALQIQAYMLKRKNDAIANSEEFWELRLGVNTGEVTAGVIGSERLAYDVWGATVNQAQRMEMLGRPGKVTITGATHQHIEPYFECTYKGKVQSKSRGLLDMYEVDRIKPELSEKGEGLTPNSRFQEIVNLYLYSSINYYKAERHIMKLLEQKLFKGLHYHGVAHSKDVVGAAERIALSENVTDEGLFLLKSAATYHDAGFIEEYDNNEPIGARLAGEILPKYGYTEQHIQKIQKLIFVTKIPHNPTTHLEEIICDADLDYLGRDDFHEIADKLRLELKEHGKIETRKEWDEIQVSFLKMHKYFTKTAIKTRQKKKMQNLKEVEERLKKNNYTD